MIGSSKMPAPHVVGLALFIANSMLGRNPLRADRNLPPASSLGGNPISSFPVLPPVHGVPNPTPTSLPNHNVVTVIKKFGSPMAVGLTQSGQVGTYRSPIYGQDAFTRYSVSSAPAVTQIGYGVHGNQ